MNSRGILVVTLVEISFLLFLIMGTTAVTLNEISKQEKKENLRLIKQNSMLSDSLNYARASIVRLEIKEDSLQHIVDSLLIRPLPGCRETGLYKDHLAIVTVVGPDLFMLEGQSTDLSGIKLRFQRYIKMRNDKICVGDILVIKGQDVSGDDFIKGFNRLSGPFYARIKRD